MSCLQNSQRLAKLPHSTTEYQIHSPQSSHNPLTISAFSNSTNDNDDSDDDMLFTPLELVEWASIDEESVYAKNGYEKLNKICDVVQGELYKAIQLSTNKYVAIKKTDKEQFRNSVTIQNNFSFCVTEDRLKEATILKYLTVMNKPIGDYIVKFIDFFEDDSSYYLVTEYIESETNLKQFTNTAHKFIAAGRLPFKQYQQIIKYILWQLMVTMKWLHVDMKTSHLDICLENIMLENCDFIADNKGNIKINPAISIKLCDFGVGEIFNPDRSTRNLKAFNAFKCKKQDLTLDNESYLAPQICKGELYDSRLADVWSSGMVLFECLTGQKLYNPADIWESISDLETEEEIQQHNVGKSHLENGYVALISGELKRYLKTFNLLKYFNTDSFDLLSNLLNVNETKRIDAFDILKHKWFSKYYKRYCQQIEAKFTDQQKRFIQNKVQMKHYQFYCIKNN